MKKQNLIYAITLLLAMFCILNKNFGQSTSSGPLNANTPVGGADYLGWLFGTGLPLEIKNEDNQPVYIHTFTGAGGLGNIRQTILGNYNATGGLIGIGDMGTTAVPLNPNYLLHSHRTGNTNVFHQFTNDNTGITATNGLRLGLRYDNTQNWSIAEFRHYMNAPMTFWTNNTERMTIHQSGEVSINTYQGFPNPVPAPAATLNVGSHSSPFSASGWAAAIQVMNRAAIFFDNAGDANNRYYFMAHPSGSPTGHTYYGLIPDADGNNIPQYIYKAHSRQLAAPNDAAQGTHQFGTGIYLWPINDPNNSLSSHYRPLLTQNVPPLYNATTEPDADVWISNIGLYQSRPFRGTTPVFSLSNTDEGIVLADQTGIFHTKLRFTGIPSDVLLGTGTWGNVGYGFGDCSHPAGPPALSNHAGLNMSGYNVYFDGQPSETSPSNPINSVGIGYACSSFLPAKLSVLRTFNTFQAAFPIALNVENSDQTSTGNAYGMHCVLTTQADRLGIGGYFLSIGNGGSISHNIGVQAYATNSQLLNHGVYGLAWGVKQNIGVEGEARVTPVYPGAFNIGVKGTCNQLNPPLGVSYAVYGDLGPTIVPCPAGPPVPPCVGVGLDFAGYFNGDVNSTTGFWVSSDASLKAGIQNLSDPMTIINQLIPKSYYFNQQANASMTLPSNLHYGLLAQDVYNVLPQLTKDCIHPARYDTLGNETHAAINYKAINYTELIPFLIAGMKEQQTQIENLENLVEELSNPLLAPPSGNDDTGNNIDVVLSSKTIVLNQNVPNPFKENTTIEYFIPDDANNVKVIFTDAKGNVIKEVEVNEKGKGQLSVYAADLSSGIYTYTIVADGITIDTKRMVKTK